MWPYYTSCNMNMFVDILRISKLFLRINMLQNIKGPPERHYLILCNAIEVPHFASKYTISQY